MKKMQSVTRIEITQWLKFDAELQRSVLQKHDAPSWPLLSAFALQCCTNAFLPIAMFGIVKFAGDSIGDVLEALRWIADKYFSHICPTLCKHSSGFIRKLSLLRRVEQPFSITSVLPSLKSPFAHESPNGPGQFNSTMFSCTPRSLVTFTPA